MTGLRSSTRYVVSVGDSRWGVTLFTTTKVSGFAGFAWERLRTLPAASFDPTGSWTRSELVVPATGAASLIVPVGAPVTGWVTKIEAPLTRLTVWVVPPTSIASPGTNRAAFASSFVTISDPLTLLMAGPVGL